MARKDKTKTKKKSKKGLSTADILKIIKKLKPQTQQIVRVNVGEDKKKKGNIQSSYNPPFVFPQQGFQAITSLGQPPFQPPLIEAPRQAATWSSQPVKEDKLLMPAPESRPPSSLYITDAESEIEILPREKRKTKKAAATPEYKVRQPYGSAEPRLKTGLTFNEPKLGQSSNLSEASAMPTRFYQPVANDKYQADIIQTNTAEDQIGTLSDKVPSALWTGTPEGDITLTVEEKQAAEEVVAPEDIFLEEPTFEEEQQQQIQEEVAVAVPTVEPKKQTPKTGLKFLLAGRMAVDEVNQAVRDNNYLITGLPTAYISTRGPTKGQIKETVRKKITSDEFEPIYDDMLRFTGRAPKKAPFVVKKTEEK